MDISFNEYKISSDIIDGLSKQLVTSPTEIQSMVIPKALQNLDIIAESYTGSGKTLAYLIPLFEKIDSSKRELQAIILAPTHELVMQIDAQIKLLAENSKIPVTSIPIIGEVNIENQIKKLKDIKPHIITGTRGRVMDLIEKKKIKPHTVKSIVIDEADTLLDNANLSSVKNIIRTTMKDRQLMAFSATIPDTVLAAATELMKDPSIFKVCTDISLNPNIAHMYLLCDRRDKFENLRKILAAVNPTKAIVFINKGEEIEIVADKLNYHKKNASGIYGSLSKEERKKIMNDFRNGNLNILVSSDLSARGLDFPEVTHIINLDFPINSNEYLHRAGRTARGTSSGTCISIITQGELAAVRVYEREFGISIEPCEVFNGKLNKTKR